METPKEEQEWKTEKKSFLRKCLKIFQILRKAINPQIQKAYQTPSGGNVNKRKQDIQQLKC